MRFPPITTAYGITGGVSMGPLNRGKHLIWPIISRTCTGMRGLIFGPWGENPPATSWVFRKIEDCSSVCCWTTLFAPSKNALWDCWRPWLLVHLDGFHSPWFGLNDYSLWCHLLSLLRKTNFWGVATEKQPEFSSSQHGWIHCLMLLCVVFYWFLLCHRQLRKKSFTCARYGTCILGYWWWMTFDVAGFGSGHTLSCLHSAGISSRIFSRLLWKWKQSPSHCSSIGNFLFHRLVRVCLPLARPSIQYPLEHSSSPPQIFQPHPIRCDCWWIRRPIRSHAAPCYPSMGDANQHGPHLWHLCEPLLWLWSVPSLGIRVLVAHCSQSHLQHGLPPLYTPRRLSKEQVPFALRNKLYDTYIILCSCIRWVVHDALTHCSLSVVRPIFTGFFFKIWDQVFSTEYPDKKCECFKCREPRPLSQWEAVEKPDYSVLLSPKWWLTEASAFEERPKSK